MQKANRLYKSPVYRDMPGDLANENVREAVSQNIRRDEAAAREDGTQKRSRSYGDVTQPHNDWTNAQPAASTVTESDQADLDNIAPQDYPYSATSQHVPNLYRRDPRHQRAYPSPIARFGVRPSTEAFIPHPWAYLTEQTSDNMEASWQDQVARNGQNAWRSMEQPRHAGGSAANGNLNAQYMAQNIGMSNNQRVIPQMQDRSFMQRYGATEYENDYRMLPSSAWGSALIAQPTMAYPPTRPQNAGIGGYAIPFEPEVVTTGNEQFLQTRNQQGLPTGNELLLLEAPLYSDGTDGAMESLDVNQSYRGTNLGHDQLAISELSNIHPAISEEAAPTEPGLFSPRCPARIESPHPPPWKKRKRPSQAPTNTATTNDGQGQVPSPPAFFANGQRRSNSDPAVLNQFGSYNERQMDESTTSPPKRQKRHASESTAQKQAGPSKKQTPITWDPDNMHTPESMSGSKRKQSSQDSQQGDGVVFGPAEPSPKETLEAQKSSRNMTSGGMFVDMSAPELIAKVTRQYDEARAKRAQKAAAAKEKAEAKAKERASSAPPTSAPDGS